MGSCYSIMGEKKSSSTTWKKKSPLSSATNANADPSLLLHIPGRFSANAATKIGCLYTQQGKKGTNQDAMLLWEVPHSRSYYLTSSPFSFSSIRINYHYHFAFLAHYYNVISRKKKTFFFSSICNV